MNDPCDSAWLKWGWAVRHGEAFEADIKHFAENPNIEPSIWVQAEYQPKRHAFAVIVTRITPEIPMDWGLRLGDIASNYRAALDHLAWTIVGRGKRPPITLKERQRKNVSFPIASDNRRFGQLVPNLLPGARRADIAVIRRYQPYHRGPSRSSRHYLSILSWLNNFDKHREIQPVLLLPTHVRYKLSNYRDCVKTRNIRPRGKSLTLQVGTELGLIPVRKTGPKPRMDVEPAISTLVGLDNQIAIIDWLDNARVWIRKLLVEFQQPPKKLLSEIAV